MLFSKYHKSELAESAGNELGLKQCFEKMIQMQIIIYNSTFPPFILFLADRFYKHHQFLVLSVFFLIFFFFFLFPSFQFIYRDINILYTFALFLNLYFLILLLAGSLKYLPKFRKMYNFLVSGLYILYQRIDGKN